MEKRIKIKDGRIGLTYCFNHPVFSQPKNIRFLWRSKSMDSFSSFRAITSGLVLLGCWYFLSRLVVIYRPFFQKLNLPAKIQFFFITTYLVLKFLYFCSGDSDVIRATHVRRNRRFRSHFFLCPRIRSLGFSFSIV